MITSTSTQILLLTGDKCVVDFISQRKLELEERDFSIGYENLTFQQVSNLVLPDNRSLSGFSIVGHIAHFNLREEHLPFRHLLGQVVVDKIPVIKTVVNKTQIIGSSEFRNFNFEIIAGETNTVTELVEHGVKFRLDFSKVYWNSRLSREHQRIVNKLSRNDILIDPFCGIGPFALPAAKKGCKVFANDLNPDAVEWLKKNVEVNKIRSECIDIFNMDAGEFVTLIVSEKLTEKILKECKSFHVTMNLPGTGYNFLPFLECLKNAEMLKHAVFVHFYCFTQKETMECESLQFIREAFRLSVDEIQLRGKISFHEVRAVSTNKIMMCLSFDLLDILPPTLTDDEAKRIKLDCEPSQ